MSTFRVADFDASRRFYEAVLAPLGFGVTSDRPDPNGGREAAFGRDALDEFAIHEPTAGPGHDTVSRGAHVAPSRSTPMGTTSRPSAT
jgi:catechol 2,3-dioxygenase-like lactoylglutathione lyase family enzyme